MFLNQDCLTLIIEGLYEDKNSLISCLLVNRVWCKTVVPILWNDPWVLLKITNDINYLKNAELLLNIILLHLSEESKNYLKNQGIDIFSTLNYQQNLLFNYLNFCKYIRHLDSNNIYDKVFCTYNNSQRYLLLQEIYKLFMSKCSTIKFLDITGILQPFYKYSGAETKLSKVYELHCKSNDDPLLFYGLSQLCRSIKKFFIVYSSLNNELAKLVELQKEVKYVKMIYIAEDDVNDQLIDQAIIKHSTSIIYLDLTIEKNLKFIINLFPKLVNLQKLFLHGSLFYRLNLNEQFVSSFHPKIRILQLCSITFSTIIKIIQNTDNNLEIIWLDSISFDSVDQTELLIQKISQHCPNLKYLKVFLKDQYLESFKQLLINCRLLEGITIYTDNLYLNYYGDELLNILIKYSPVNLHKLELCYCKFKVESLNLFFSNWRNKKALWLYSVNIEDNGLCHSKNNSIEKFNNMIGIYKRNGIIKNFEPYKSYNFIDDYKEIRI